MNDFDGLVAVVTGGGSGIGAATASLLLNRGARVAIIDREPKGAPPGCLPLRADLADDTTVRRAVDAIAGTYGRLDVVINNAGLGAIGDITANDDAQWARVLTVNVTGIARVMRSSLPYLRQSDNAAVVNLCSAVAFVGVRNRALYSASKGAVAALTLAMAADYAAEGIRVNAVAPGTADTPWVARLLADADDPEAAAVALRNRQPLGRLISADEVAHAVAALASPLAASTTGSILRVDGGMTSIRI